MADPTNSVRLYSDLAWLWPMWGDPAGEYAHYGAHAIQLIRQHARRPVASLLNIACGGGKNVFNLKEHFKVTGLDLSPTMLALARTLNPGCEFIEGDMRSFSLGRTFDAILMDDGISYMASRGDLAAAFQTAFRHLNPGGVMIATADVTSETFRQNHTETTSVGAGGKPGDLHVVFIENWFDPDPADEHYETTLVYLIREKGKLRLESDCFRLGLFPRETWKQTLSEAGFGVHDVTYGNGTSEYVTFVCTKPVLKEDGKE